MTEPTAREQLQTLLDLHRPDRYDPTDRSWQAPIVDLVAEELTAAEARAIAADRIVSRAEAEATKRTNRLLREIASSGEWPLGWLDALSWPLAVHDGERVALRAATPDDLANFANRERRSAANDFAQRNLTCEGALLLAERMTAQGADLVGRFLPDVLDVAS